eukprot:TRINITY_DN1194_c0_g4_i1.p1 TRINITY_DN1194_c0_g4~~TRINITY_DN1194_c0_g4_i1.p1  ORF type:complete len:577 (+),score=190.17 TRINITY_DN1194_c0_g4_i1:2193-3923(+)
MEVLLREAKDELAHLLGEVGEEPEAVLKEMERAVEEIREVVARYQGGSVGSGEVAANEKEVERLLKTDSGECEAYYLLNSSRQVIDGLAGDEKEQHLKAHHEQLQQLGTIVLASLKREAAHYPLLEVTPTPYDCPTISSRLTELWRIALTLHTDGQATDPSVIFTHPFERAFARHFDPSLPTGDPTKPEFPLRYCLSILQSHWSVMKHLEGSPSNDFCILVLSKLGGWITDSLEQQQDRDFFYYTLNEMLSFDESLSTLPLAHDHSLCREVLTHKYTEWWVEVERQKVSSVMTGSVRGGGCWVPSVPWFLLEYDKWKTGKGAVELFFVLNALAKKLGKARLQHDTVKHFVTALFTPVLTEIATLAEDLTAKDCGVPAALDDHSAPLLRLVVALNSMTYLLGCVESWRVYPVFCATEMFSDASDALSLARDTLVKSLSAVLAAPLVSFKGSMSNLMMLYPALHKTQFLCEYYKTYGAEGDVYGPCFHVIEQHMVKHVLPRATPQCFAGAVSKVSSLIESYGGSVTLLHSAVPPSSPPSPQRQSQESGFFSRIYSTESQPVPSSPSPEPAEGSDDDWT